MTPKPASLLGPLFRLRSASNGDGRANGGVDGGVELRLVIAAVEPEAAREVDERLLFAQLALSLDGADREEILAQLVDLLATRERTLSAERK